MENISLLQLTEGLRKDYQQSVLELKALKKYVKVFDKKVKDYHLALLQTNLEENPDLVMYAEFKRNKFEKLCDKISMALGTYAYGQSVGEFYRTLSNRYYIDSPFYQAQVIDDELFHEQLEKITNSKFYKNIGGYYVDDNATLDISANEIWYIDGESEFKYNADKDNIIINNISDDKLLEPIVLFDRLNQYHQETIVNNLRIYYPFEIVKNDSDSNIYKIEEEKKKNLLLQR